MGEPQTRPLGYLGFECAQDRQTPRPSVERIEKQNNKKKLPKPDTQPPKPRSPKLFFFFFTLVTGPKRSLSLQLSDTKSMSLKYEPASVTTTQRLLLLRELEADQTRCVCDQEAALGVACQKSHLWCHHPPAHQRPLSPLSLLKIRDTWFA